MTPEIEHKKRCLYREWYSKRNQPTILDKRKTHNERFQAIYGETLDEYHARLKAENEKSQHGDTINFYRKAGR